MMIELWIQLGTLMVLCTGINAQNNTTIVINTNTSTPNTKTPNTNSTIVASTTTSTVSGTTSMINSMMTTTTPSSSLSSTVPNTPSSSTTRQTSTSPTGVSSSVVMPTAGTATVSIGASTSTTQNGASSTSKYTTTFLFEPESETSVMSTNLTSTPWINSSASLSTTTGTGTTTKLLPSSTSKPPIPSPPSSSTIQQTSTSPTGVSSSVVMPTVSPSWTNWTTEKNCQKKCCGTGGTLTLFRACTRGSITLNASSCNGNNSKIVKDCYDLCDCSSGSMVFAERLVAAGSVVLALVINLLYAG